MEMDEDYTFIFALLSTYKECLEMCESLGFKIQMIESTITLETYNRLFCVTNGIGVSGRGSESNPVVFLGLAYCTTSSGTSTYKLASAYYEIRAYERLDRALPWQKLETLTQPLIVYRV